MNGHVGCQEGLLEEVMFRRRRVGPAVVMEAETGGKAMRAEGVARRKAMKLESEQTLWTERQEVGRSQARASRRSPGAFCILCILGVLSSLPEGRRGPPTQNARIVAAGSQAMKRPDLEGRLVKPGGGRYRAPFIAQKFSLLVPGSPGCVFVPKGTSWPWAKASLRSWQA